MPLVVKILLCILVIGVLIAILPTIFWA